MKKEFNRPSTYLFILLLISISLLGYIIRHPKREGEILSPLVSLPPLTRQVEAKGPDDIFVRYCKGYESLARCIVFKESGGRSWAEGDWTNGRPLAIGVAQFHLPTWKIFRKKMGLSIEDQRQNIEESVKTMCWAIGKGYGYHWSTYKNCQ